MSEEATAVDIPGPSRPGRAVTRAAHAHVPAHTPAPAPAHTPAPNVPIRPHMRLWHGMRRPDNWLQLVRFSVVGASGYAVNLLLYALCVKAFGIQYLVAESVAWIVAAANNFVWNRHWTFKARAGQIHMQAIRFFLVSLVALAFNLIVLRVLVETGGMDKLAAEVIALAASTPVNFLGNKLWSFRTERAEG